MITIDDFVMLGKTVPEPTKDGRIFVCSAGVSPQLRKLVRIYPLARRGAPARWSVNKVALERNSSDIRDASWQLPGDRTLGAHEHINNNAFTTEQAEYPRSKRAALLRPYEVGSIKEANAKRLSLAIIHASNYELGFDYNPDSPDSPQLALFDDGKPEPQGAKRFAYIPRLHFRDEDRENHLMLRDWGCFEWMRKEGDHRRNDLPGCLRLSESSSLLIGNFNRHFTSWLVISVLNGIREPSALFDLESA